MKKLLVLVSMCLFLSFGSTQTTTADDEGTWFFCNGCATNVKEVAGGYAFEMTIICTGLIGGGWLVDVWHGYGPGPFEGTVCGKSLN